MAEVGKGRIVIAGGSGFLGHALIQEFQSHGYEIVVLTRSRKKPGEVQTVVWDGQTVGEWAGFLNGAVAVVNLAGEAITQRWTDENRKKILDSRIKSTEVIGKAIRACSSPPKVWINASGVGYYGDCGDRELDEDSPAGEGFMSEVCLAWERAQEQSEVPGTRKVRLRIGAVLGRGGGAFEELAKFTKMFLGGSQGSGKQWMSWIHVEDLARIFRWAVESDFSGAVNGVSPNPERNSDLMAAMREVYGRPWSPPAPGFAMKLAGSVLGLQTDILLQSQRAASKVLRDREFEYKWPELRQALENLRDLEPK